MYKNNENITKFKPRSIPFIILSILIPIIMLGAFPVVIVGIIKKIIWYILIGIIGFIIMLIEYVKALSSSILFLQDCLKVSNGVFETYLHNVTKQIKYEEIDKIVFKRYPLPIIFIINDKLKRPVSIYVKQYSRKQVYAILEELESKTSKKVEYQK